MNKIKFVLLLLLVIAAPAWGREVLYRGDSVDVGISTGRTTQVIFPSGVRNIVTSLDQVQISVEVFNNILYIQPLHAPQGNIFVNTADGTGYGLYVRTVPPDEVDSTVKIKLPESAEPEKRSDSTIIHYMRQLLTGAAERTAGVAESGSTVYEDENIKIILDRVYTWPHYTGWICTAVNVSRGAVVVPVQQVSAPKLRAISTDTETLEPRQTARVYMLMAK